jgi:hypothetical protein
MRAIRHETREVDVLWPGQGGTSETVRHALTVIYSSDEDGLSPLRVWLVRAGRKVDLTDWCYRPGHWRFEESITAAIELDWLEHMCAAQDQDANARHDERMEA